MSITSISTSSASSGIVSIAGSSSLSALAQTAVVNTANQTQTTQTSQTTVTISAASAALGAAQDSTTATESDALQFGENALDNSQLILQTGQVNMAAAMQSFGTDWDTEKQTIAGLRPDLLNKNWDITTDQGTIQATSGTLSASDKAWLTGILNQNANLVKDTQNINNVIVGTFGGTAAMAAEDPMGMTLSGLNQSSVDGTVHFLALLSAADNSSYNSALIPIESGEKYFKVTAPVGSVLNNPVVGNISSIEELDPISAQEGTLAFQHKVTVFADKSDQADMYAYTLNIAFKQFLQPAFASSGAADGTDILAGMNVTSDVLSLLSDKTPFNGIAALWWTSANPGGETQCQTQEQLIATASSLSKELGSSYRTYGAALTPSDTTTSLFSNDNSSETTTTTNGSSSSPIATSGVSSINSVYTGNAQNLSGVQKFIAPAIQSLSNSWNIVKATIATERPDLLDKKWDFVTDNGTVQATSTSLTAEQKSWLTGILNQNQDLVADTQTINKQMVSFYKDNPLVSGTSSAQSGGSQANTGLPALSIQNIDGVIPFLALLSGEDPATLIRKGLENETNNQASSGFFDH